jgi:hypothetical protein
LDDIPDAEPIVSETNPEFRDEAKALADYRKATLTNAHSAAKSSEVGRFRRSRQALERSGAALSGYTEDSSGNLTSSRTGKAGVPDEENCALWLTNIQPSATIADILSVVRTGAVYALHINPAFGTHTTAAAKLVFMKPSAAARFYQQVNSREGVAIHGGRIRAVYNKFGFREYTHQERSRVIWVQGPAQFMTFEFWDKYFKTCVAFDLESWDERSVRSNEKVLTFAFARLDGQAEAVYHAIKKEQAYQGVFDVRYGRDPCDPSEV